MMPLKKKTTKKHPPATKRPAKKSRNAVQPLTRPPATLVTRYPVLDDFFEYQWGSLAPRNAYGVYALCLYANYPDYADIAANALTEGGDDKDCDLCLIDTETGDAFVVQATLADEWNKPTAPTNKADDLLTAMSWLLTKQFERIPLSIRAKAVDLQGAIARNEIKTIHLLFVHNCQQSDAVSEALQTVAASAKTLIGNVSVNVSASEIGLPRLQHLYDSLTKQIVVEDTIEIPVNGSLSEAGDGWEAVQTTIGGVVLHDLWQKYKDDLFSANIRGFLDMLTRRTSINRGILETVTQSPSSFWAFNNGVTLLTKSITTKKPGVIVIKGASVINGAQTTGVLGNAPRDLASLCRVPCRLIKCSDIDLVDQIIENNNTQNAIKAFDIRSNDQVQRSLHAEFKGLGIVYLHRRQGAQRLSPNAIQAEPLAPVLAAFHDNFQVAFRQRRTIFEDRSVYGEVFPNQISAGHVILVQALSITINDYRLQLVEGGKVKTLNEPEVAIHDFLNYSTSKLFIIAVIGRIASQIVGHTIPDLFGLKVSTDYCTSSWRDNLVGRWMPLVESLVPLIVLQIDGNAKDVVRSNKELDKVAKKVSFQLQSLRSQYDSVMSPIRDVCTL